MKKGMKRALATGIVACMALTSLAGCSKKETFDASAAILTVDGQEVPAGLVKFMVHATQAASESFYSMYYGSGAFNMALDAEGTTLGSLVKDGSITEMKQMILAEQHAQEYGVALTEEEKAAITEAATAFMSENEEEVLGKMGASQEIVERYLELYTIQDKVEVHMGADVDTEVSDEEAAQRKIQYVYFTAASEEAAEAEAETEEETAALTEEDAEKTQSAEETEEAETETEDPEDAVYMAKALAKAEAVIEKVKAGEDFAAAVAAVDESKTPSEMTLGADSDSVYEELLAATEGLADGTLVEEPVKTEYGYYAVQVVAEFDQEATDERKEEIVEERRIDLVNSMYTEWEEAVEITQDDKLIAEIVFDFSLTPVVETEAAETESSETEA